MTRCPNCGAMAETLRRCPTCFDLGCTGEDCIFEDEEDECLPCQVGGQPDDVEVGDQPDDVEED